MAGQPISDKFQDEIEAIVEKYNDSGITVGEVVAVLETVKFNELSNARDDDEKEEFE